MCGLHIGVVIPPWCTLGYNRGCCHGHAVFRKLSFLHILYKDNAYNFDYKHRRRRFTCSGVRIVMVISHELPPQITRLLRTLLLGRKIAPPHGGFESRFEYLYVESTSTTRTKLLNLRVKPPCGLVATHVALVTFCCQPT